MDIKTYEWRTGLGGLPAGGWKSSFTSRDMLKFGTLAMNKGKWNGEQLIPEAYISKATSRVLYVGDDQIFGGGKDVSNQGYGYFWWTGDLKYGDKSYFSTSAQGGSGQYIILFVELDLIVVATGSHRGTCRLQRKESCQHSFNEIQNVRCCRELQNISLCLRPLLPFEEGIRRPRAWWQLGYRRVGQS